MDYSWVEEVIELTDISKLNEHLKLGWQIINIYNAPSQSEDISHSSQKQVFTIAWSKNNALRSDLTVRYDDWAECAL